MAFPGQGIEMFLYAVDTPHPVVARDFSKCWGVAMSDRVPLDKIQDRGLSSCKRRRHGVQNYTIHSVAVKMALGKSVTMFSTYLTKGHHLAEPWVSVFL